MTIEEAKKSLVAKARSQVGYKEGPNNQNKYADDPKITKLYGWTPQHQPWCCVFVNWCYLNTFGYDIGSRMTYGGTAACANSAALFRNNGALMQTPEVGDQIFFFSGGGINHTGIVVEVNGASIKTIEGNYSDGVGIGSYIVGSSKIAGYGRPKWSLVQSDDVTAPQNPVSTENGQISNLDNHTWRPKTVMMSNAYSSDCVVLQAILNVKHFPCGEVDGFFGAKTQAALNKAQQYYKLEVDGVCGPKTWEKLMEVEK